MDNPRSSEASPQWAQPLGPAEPLTFKMNVPRGYAARFRPHAIAIAQAHAADLHEHATPTGCAWWWTTDATVPLEQTAATCVDLLTLLAALDMDLLDASRRAGRPLPSVLDRALHFPGERGAELHQPIRYARERGEGHGWEELANVWDVHRRGWADCDDIVGAVIAERALRGERCTPTVYFRKNGGIHAQVRLESGRIIDPARSLGM